MVKKELREKLKNEFNEFMLRLESSGELNRYTDNMKIKYPLGFERHPLTEGLKELRVWYLWHGRDVKDLEGFKNFVDKYLDIIYAIFENKEKYKEIGLDGFKLKMRQGETFKIGNGAELFSIPISENIRGIYRKWNNGQHYRELKCDLRGLLDCRNNKLIMDRFHLGELSLLLPEYDSNFTKDTPESRKRVKELYDITYLEEIFEEVNELICRYKSDVICENVENRRLIVKDLPLDYEKKYDDIQNLAMGINNYIYTSLKRLDDNEVYTHVLGYLDKGLEYLHKLVAENEELVSKYDYKKSEYLNLVKTYSNVKGNMDRIIGSEIKGAIEGKNSVYVNDIQYKEVYCFASFAENHIGTINGRGSGYPSMDLDKVETLRFGKKEIFNRKEAVKRLGSAEYQAGINGLIYFVRNHFDRYDKEIGADAAIGDLVFTKGGHFGIVTGKDKITLDNGRQDSVVNANIFIKANELNNGLSQIKRFIENENGIGKKKSAEQQRFER